MKDDAHAWFSPDILSAVAGGIVGALGTGLKNLFTSVKREELEVVKDAIKALEVKIHEDFTQKSDFERIWGELQYIRERLDEIADRNRK